MTSRGSLILREIKNCRKYRKHIYELPVPITEGFFTHFEFLGKPEITSFSKFSSLANDFFKIRNDAYAVEVAGGVQATELFITFSKNDSSIVAYLEEELESWLAQNTTSL